MRFIVLVLVAVSCVACASNGGASNKQVKTVRGGGSHLAQFDFWDLVDHSAGRVWIDVKTNCDQIERVDVHPTANDDEIGVLVGARRDCSTTPAWKRIQVGLPRDIGCDGWLIDAATHRRPPEAEGAPSPPVFACPASPARSSSP